MRQEDSLEFKINWVYKVSPVKPELQKEAPPPKETDDGVDGAPSNKCRLLFINISNLYK